MQSLLIILGSLLVLLVSVPNQAYAAGPVSLNEVLTHPNAGSKEWVEFYVTDSSNLKNYWIDDDADFASDEGGSAKKSLDGVIAGSDSQHYYIELSASMFNNDGDTVVLFNPNGSIADQLTYTDGPGYDVAMGRYPDGTGSFAYLSNPTRGSANAGPMPTATDEPEPTAKPAVTQVASSNQTQSGSTISRTTATRTPTTRVSSPTSSPRISGVPISPRSVSPSAKVASRGAYPTAVLGAKTKANEPTRIPLPSIPMKVKGASSAPALFTILGAGFIIACAVLLFLKKLKQRA